MERVEVPVGSFTFSGLADGPEEGDLVLLLHGFPQTSWEWRHQIDALAAAGHRALAVDQRGYSPGARPADVEQYAMRHLVADVLAVADWVGGHTFHLVGHDWGGAVAWQVAGRYPQRVRTLTVVSTPHPGAFRRALRGERGSDQAARSGYMAELAADGAAERLLADDAARLRGFLAGVGLDEGAAEPYLAALGEPAALDAALNWYRVAGRGGLEGLGPVTSPTLFVWGADDPALGPEAAEMTGEHVEGPYRFEPLEGVGHWVPEAAPERLNALLLAHVEAAGAT